MAKDEIIRYMRSETVLQRFADTLGAERNAAPYITSVLLAVGDSDFLQACSPESIYKSALRAATLRLSCDPGAKQAYLVPFKNSATLIIGYKGLYDLAVRTGKYRFIHVSKIYKGEEIIEDRITGALSIEGGKKSDTIAGWLASFQMFDGFSKSIYMSVEEIHAHARKYSKGYERKDGAWKTATSAMERKTVLRNLIMNWGYLDPSDAPLVASDEEDHEVDISDAPIIDTEFVEEEPELTEQELLAGLGY